MSEGRNASPTLVAGETVRKGEIECDALERMALFGLFLQSVCQGSLGIRTELSRAIRRTRPASYYLLVAE
jgi:hypothetical protein